MAEGQYLPLGEYFALLSYQSILLLTSFLFFPRPSSWFLASGLPQTQSSSVDRPEHPFLTPLTINPLGTMAWNALGTLVIMVWWSQHMSSWWRALGHGEKMMNEKEVSLRKQRVQKKINRLIETALATIAAAALGTPVIVALGAPLDVYILRTLLFALHLSVLIVWPVVYTFGLAFIGDAGINDRYRLKKLFCELQIDTPMERALVYPIIGAVCGAWLGAIPVLLDWDRPWQSYPLTLAVGSMLGFITGGFTSFAHCGVDVLREDFTYGAVASRAPGSTDVKVP